MQRSAVHDITMTNVTRAYARMDVRRIDGVDAENRFFLGENGCIDNQGDMRIRMHVAYFPNLDVRQFAPAPRPVKRASMHVIRE